MLLSKGNPKTARSMLSPESVHSNYMYPSQMKFTYRVGILGIERVNIRAEKAVRYTQPSPLLAARGLNGLIAVLLYTLLNPATCIKSSKKILPTSNQACVLDHSALIFALGEAWARTSSFNQSRRN